MNTSTLNPIPQKKVQVWIYQSLPLNRFRVLFLHLIPQRGAYWQPVTGGVDPGESLEAAALREAQEETHLTFTDPPRALPYSFEYTHPTRGSQIESAFVLEVQPTPAAQTAPQVLLDPLEHDQYVWKEGSLESLRTLKDFLKQPSNQVGLEHLICYLQSKT